MDDCGGCVVIEEIGEERGGTNMNGKIKVLALGLISAIGLWGQKVEPIWQEVFTGRTTTGISGNLSNIGQNQHVIFVRAYDVTPASCTTVQAGLIAMKLEGSYDNSNWTGISNIVKSNQTASLTFYGFGFASMPFLRINILAVSSGGTCQFDVAYTGSLQTTPSVQSFNTEGLGLERIITSVVGGAGTFHNIGITQRAGQRLVVYGLIVEVVTTAISWTLQEHTDTTCATPVSSGDTIAAQSTSITANQVYNFGRDIVWFWRATTTGSTLCIGASGASNYRVTTWYRFE